MSRSSMDDCCSESDNDKSSKYSITLRTLTFFDMKIEICLETVSGTSLLTIYEILVIVITTS